MNGKIIIKKRKLRRKVKKGKSVTKRTQTLIVFVIIIKNNKEC